MNQTAFSKAPIIVMGVSGSGKSSVATALAEILGRPFIEGDSLHPAENIAKMSSGVPLDDDDRFGWLQRICAGLKGPQAPVVSCSALKEKYRQQLRQCSSKPVVFLYLRVDRVEIIERMSKRAHFMPVGLVDSQFATLEEPGDEEDVITIEGPGTPHELAARFISLSGHWKP